MPLSYSPMIANSGKYGIADTNEYKMSCAPFNFWSIARDGNDYV